MLTLDNFVAIYFVIFVSTTHTFLSKRTGIKPGYIPFIVIKHFEIFPAPSKQGEFGYTIPGGQIIISIRKTSNVFLKSAREINNEY